MSDLTARLPDLDRGLLSDQIYSMIKGMIRDSTLRPGEQLVESQLAKQLKVSQSPVREALKRLTHDGLVQQVRHHGSFVADYSRDEAEQAKVARVALEELAGRFACGRLDPAAHEALESLIGDMSASAALNDITAFREFDFEFHRAVIVASGNSYLPRMWDIIEPSLRSLHVLSDPNFSGDWGKVAETHRDLLNVLDGEDPEAAADLFRRHASGGLQISGADRSEESSTAGSQAPR
jgi:DNA-binding GntR family transcriptional regulator